MSETIDLNAPEVQEAIKQAVAEANAGLAKKNGELLAELKKARKNSEIDPEEYNRVRDENEALTTQLADLAKNSKKFMTDHEALKKQLESESSFTKQLLIDNGITDALTMNGVTNPVLMKAAKALLQGQAQIVADGDSRLAMIGDKKAHEFIAEWAKSDEGAHFVAAPANSGGNAQGGQNGQGAAKTMPRSQFDSLDQMGRAEFVKSGGKPID